jgi:hypothetical protein
MPNKFEGKLGFGWGKEMSNKSERKITRKRKRWKKSKSI